MTPEERNDVRVRVARELGWKVDDVALMAALGDRIPNFPESLDACAQFEATLTEKEELFYMMELMKQMQLTGTIGTRADRTYKATALQRCLAFLAVRARK